MFPRPQLRVYTVYTSVKPPSLSQPVWLTWDFSPYPTSGPSFPQSLPVVLYTGLLSGQGEGAGEVLLHSWELSVPDHCCGEGGKGGRGTSPGWFLAHIVPHLSVYVPCFSVWRDVLNGALSSMLRISILQKKGSLAF